jgi:hypothetical protein
MKGYNTEVAGPKDSRTRIPANSVEYFDMTSFFLPPVSDLIVSEGYYLVIIVNVLCWSPLPEWSSKKSFAQQSKLNCWSRKFTPLELGFSGWLIDGWFGRSVCKCCHGDKWKVINFRKWVFLGLESSWLPNWWRSFSIKFSITKPVLMAFKTFVQVGRAVLITTGPETGKLGVIGTSLSFPPFTPKLVLTS